MTTPTPDLTRLSADDLLLNLWAQLLIMAEHFEFDPADWHTSAVRTDVPEPAPDEQPTTLAALMAEVERRLELAEHQVESVTAVMQ